MDARYVRFPRVAAWIAATYVAVLTTGVLARWLPIAALVVTVVMSSVAYFVYRADKSRAQRATRRIPEQTLHVVALLGGWPGALVAQWRLRHKNRKLSFQLVFWLTVAAHFAALYFLAR